MFTKLSLRSTTLASFRDKIDAIQIEVIRPAGFSASPSSFLGNATSSLHQTKRTFARQISRNSLGFRKKALEDLSFSAKVMSASSKESSLGSNPNDNSSNKSEMKFIGRFIDPGYSAPSSASSAPVTSFKRGSEVWVYVDKFGVLGATVRVIPVSSQDPKTPPSVAQFEASEQSGLILQKEISVFQSRKEDGNDVAVGDILRGWVSRAYNDSENDRSDGSANHIAHEKTAARGTGGDVAGTTGVKLDIALRPLGVDRIEDNSQLLLSMLQQSANGELPIGDRSDPADIQRILQNTMGKTDFKNAVGALYRQGLVQPGLTHLRLLTKVEREALLRSAKHQITSKFLNRNNNLNASDSDATTQYSNSTKKTFKKDARLFIANIPEDVTGATLYAFLIRHLDDEKDRAEIVSVRNRRQSFRPEYTTSSIASSSIASSSNGKSNREKSDAEVAAEQMTFDGFAFINVESERVRDRLLQKLNGVKWRGRKLRLDGEDRRPESDEKGAEEGKKEKKPRHKKLLRLAAEAEAAKLQPAKTSSEQSLAQAQVDTIVAKETLRGERRGVSLSRAMSDIKSDVETPNRFDEENRRNDHSSSSSSSNNNNYSNSKKLQEESRSSMVEIDDFFSAPSPTGISAVRREKRVQQPIEEDLDTIDGFASNSTFSHKRISRSSSATEGDRKGLVTLYVGNLSYQTSEEALRDFVQSKLQKMRMPVTVVDARIVTDGFSGRKRGFGYIDLKMPSKSSQDTTMKAVLKQLDEQQLDGRSLRVNPAEEHPKK